jgi:multicomponent Na+:H+ antiporter subunit F
MTPQLFLAASEELALGILALAVILALIRLLRGPGLADRIVALDMLTMLAISLIGVLALRLGQPLLLDIAVALCLVGFVSTVALIRLLLMRGKSGDDSPIAGQQSRSGE